MPLMFETRPWGGYRVLLAAQAGHQLKELLVNPGCSLSLQSHQHRSEHWVVVKGQARVQCDQSTIDLVVGEHIYIPCGAKHRLQNPSHSEPLLVIEVQLGAYLGEDDITRYQDDYGRC